MQIEKGLEVVRDFEFAADANLERIIFHIVGPDFVSPKILLEVEDPGSFSDFFIARLKETLKGTAYHFNADAWVKQQVIQALTSEHAFVDVSERLAIKFQELYASDKRLAPGVLMLLKVKSGSDVYGAIIKYDDMSVVSYKTEEMSGGKAKPILSQFLNNFVQDKKAVQKSVLINTIDSEFSKVICIDRSGAHGDLTDKFKDYLEVHRSFSTEMLTERLVEALIEVGKAHAGIIPAEIRKKLTASVNQAVKDVVDFDPENPEKLLAAAFGEAHANTELQKAFEGALKKKKISNEKFLISVESLKIAKSKVKQTFEGIRVVYNKKHEDENFISFSTEGGRKVIKIITDDYVVDDDE
ncbi:hypothetical protein PMI35_02295 [Pseudomonas sp. GM78]|uniref:nucleoid-associated protein n=1 Tax=Pseudomonas sp. GM78 TaxID=1144337 RepID=UPI0002707A17|nr:nucleoid-associated protein [Pseudomonas sp. GM78]EJN29841.1 hypothetical protein PMI35_02295 [Pseudomonas sp. GM78]